MLLAAGAVSCVRACRGAQQLFCGGLCGREAAGGMPFLLPFFLFYFLAFSGEVSKLLEMGLFAVSASLLHWTQCRGLADIMSFSHACASCERLARLTVDIPSWFSSGACATLECLMLGRQPVRPACQSHAQPHIFFLPKTSTTLCRFYAHSIQMQRSQALYLHPASTASQTFL